MAPAPSHLPGFGAALLEEWHVEVQTARPLGQHRAGLHHAVEALRAMGAADGSPGSTGERLASAG